MNSEWGHSKWSKVVNASRLDKYVSIPEGVTLDEDFAHEVISGHTLLPEQLVLPKYRTEYHDFIGYIVIDAIETLIGRKVAKGEDWDEDYNWLVGTDTQPWSYAWCCKVLGINQIEIRRIVLAKLKRATKRGENKVTLRTWYKPARKGGRPKRALHSSKQA